MVTQGDAEGRLATSQSSTGEGQSQVQAPAQGKGNLALTGASLGRQSLRNQVCESSDRKGTQSKGNGPVPKAKVTRDQSSLLSQRAGDQAESVCGLSQGQVGAGGPSGSHSPTSQVQAPPHKLSLLEVVLAPSSVSRAQRRRSQLSGVPPSAASIQGWAEIWSSEGRSEGRRDRHH